MLKGYKKIKAEGSRINRECIFLVKITQWHAGGPGSHSQAKQNGIFI